MVRGDPKFPDITRGITQNESSGSTALQPEFICDGSLLFLFLDDRSLLHPQWQNSLKMATKWNITVPQAM